MKFNPLTLSFDSSLEKKYQEQFFKSSIYSFRFAFLSVTLLYGLFSILDYLLIEELFFSFFQIRFFVVIPFLIFIYFFSFTKYFKEYWQGLLFFSFIISGTGIITMLVLAPENYSYYLGLMLILSAGYFFVKIRFLLASIAGLILLMIFNIGLILYSNLSYTLIFAYNFFFISENVICMIASYYIELTYRKNFYLSIENENQKKNLEVLNNQLEVKVEKTTEELINSEEKYRHITECITDVVWITDLKFKTLYISPSVEKLVGVTPEDYMKKSINENYNEESLKLFKVLYFEEFEKEKDPNCNKNRSRVIEAQHILPNGEYLWVSMNISFLRNKEGIPIGLQGVTRDISEQKKAEELLTKNEERLRLSLNASKQGIFDLNLETGETIINEEYALMLGYQPNSFKETHSYWIERLHPEDKDKAIENFNNYISNITSEYSNEFRQKTYDNKWKWIYCTGKIVSYNENGKPSRMLGIHTDITERKQLENELILAKERAEESDRLKSTFLANMSHEIRTPMNGILGFAELLKEPNLTGEEQKKYLEIIENSGERMLNIINDLINISKIEAGLVELFINETNINEIMEYTYNFFKPEVESKGMNLYVNKILEYPEAFIKTDKEKMYAIITNLVKNAIKYSINGYIEFGYVWAKNNSNNPEIEFYVYDTGIGIHENRIDVIFDRFIQADVTDKQSIQGAGLGLAITKAYVEMMGGKISVVSTVGVGSRFSFTLPYNA